MSRVLLVDDHRIVGRDREPAQTGIFGTAEPWKLPWPKRRWSDEAGRSRNRSRDTSAITGGLPSWAAGLRLALLMLALVSPGAMAQTAIEKPRTIRVVMDNNYAPFVLQSDEGKLQGILIDQWQLWEKKTGIKADIHAMDWSEALRRMRAGEFDVIDSIVETAERRDYFDFTPAYTTIEASIYFRNEISGITDLASLKGFPVGVKTGDQHIDKLKANGVTTVIPFQNNDAIIEAAKQHKINVFVVDDPSGLYLLNKMGIEEEFRHSAPIFRDELRRAVRKGDAATLSRVSEGFAAIEPDELRQIDEKWFGRAITRIGRYLTYAGYAAAAALLLIAGLAAWNRMLRKKILQRTAALGESEQRFRQLAENIHEVFWLTDTEKQTLFYVSPAYEDIWGRTCASHYAAPMDWLNAIHPEDRQRVRQAAATQQATGAYDEEYRIIRPDGSICWVSDRAFPVRNAAGEVYRIAGVAEDITERKQAEDALKNSYDQLRALSARLQSVREEEATRIAREIHDDLGQKLTGLKMDLLSAERKIEKLESSPMVNSLLDTIVGATELTDKITASVQEIAANLRPEMLDKLGLSAALHYEVRRFQERTGILCEVRLPETDPNLSPGISTTLFRILQECLTNISRHANATKIKAALKLEDGWVTLRVQDNGRGIAEAEIANPESLGLLGMKERTALLGGEIVFQRGTQGGTNVTASIPQSGTSDQRKEAV